MQSNVISISALKQEIHRLVNQERQKYNLKSLFFDIKLSNIAQYHIYVFMFNIVELLIAPIRIRFDELNIVLD